MAVGALATAAVDVVANLDTFEPDLKRKLEGAIRTVSKAVEKDFDKLGARAGKAFSDAAAKVAQSSTSFDDVGRAAERLERTSVSAARGMSDGFKLPLDDVQKLEAAVRGAADSQSDALGKVRVAQVQLTEARKKSGDASSQAIAAEERLSAAQRNAARDSQRLLQVTEALVTAREDAFRKTGEAAGEAAGGGFGDGFRKTARRGADDGGRDAGGFFARAFETAASRAVGTGLLRTFAVGLTSLITAASPLSTILGGATAAVVALAAALATASGSAIALGGVLASLGLVAGTLAVGFQGVGDAMKAQTKALEELRVEGEISAATQEKLDAALKNLAPSAAAVVTQLGAMQPAWEAVRRVVQEKLFAGVATQIANLGNRFLPILTSQLGIAATTLNNVAVQMARFLGTSERASQIGVIFGRLNSILATLTPVIAPLAAGFLDIFEASLPFAQGLALVLRSLGLEFANFLSQAVAGGNFQAFMENAMTVAGDLFRLLGNIGSIIGSVFGAGTAAGANLLDILADLTGEAARFFNSADGQAALAGFFGLIAQAGSILVGIFKTLSPLLSGIGNLFKALQPALQALGAALVPIIGQLATQLGGALTQLAPLFAELIRAVIPLATAIGTVLVTQFTNLVPVIVALVQGLIPLVTTLVSGLVPAFEAFLPVSNQLAPILLQIAQAFLAALLPSVQAIVPLIPQLVTSALQLVQALIALLPSLIPLIGPAAEFSLAMTQLLLALAPLIPPLVQLSVITLNQLAPALTAIVGFIVPVITSFTDMTNKVTAVVTAIVNFVVTALTKFAEFRAGGTSAVQSLTNAVVGFIAGMVMSIVGSLSSLVQQGKDLFTTFKDGVVNIAKTIGSGVIDAIKSGLSGLAGAFRAPFDSAKEAVSSALESIIGVVSGAIGRIEGLVSRISGALGKIKIPGGGGIDIPGFAKGGIINRPTLATFAEKGPEAAIPLTDKTRAAEIMDQSGLTQLALERALGNNAVQSGTGGRTREINMPVTVAGLTKEETLQALRDFLESTFGPRLGLSTAEGAL